MSTVDEPLALIYREEVLSILWALADLGVNRIQELLEEDGEEEEEQEGDL